VPSKHDPADCLADILENIERIGAYMASLDRTEHSLRETAARVTPSSAAWSASVKQCTAWEIRRKV